MQWLEHIRKILGSNAGSGIGYRELKTLRGLRPTDSDASSSRGVADGIIQQIFYGPREEPSIDRQERCM